MPQTQISSNNKGETNQKHKKVKYFTTVSPNWKFAVAAADILICDQAAANSNKIRISSWGERKDLDSSELRLIQSGGWMT